MLDTVIHFVSLIMFIFAMCTLTKIVFIQIEQPRINLMHYEVALCIFAGCDLYQIILWLK